MEYYSSKNINIDEKTVVTLGNFDGFHIGHLSLVDKIKEYDFKKVVFSFYPHPVALMKDEPFFTLFSNEEKREILKNMEVDTFIEYPFDKETSNLSPRDFIIDVVIEKLNAKVIVIGEDYRFGKNKLGDYNLLKVIGKEYDVEIVSIPHILNNGEKVSSTMIRNLLVNREIEEVSRLLGKPYFIYGTVTMGKKLGRTIGFPTINIVPSKNKLLPPSGVYRSRVIIENESFFSITNIGTNPTVSGTNTVSESHIFNYNGNLYGKKVKVEILKWIRDEKKFNSIDELKEQISIDVNTYKK